MERAECRGKAPNLRENPDARDPWFPSKGQSPNEGRIICFICPVRAECEDYRARTRSTYGMWAGFIPKRDKQEEEEDD